MRSSIDINGMHGFLKVPCEILIAHAVLTHAELLEDLPDLGLLHCAASRPQIDVALFCYMIFRFAKSALYTLVGV